MLVARRSCFIALCCGGALLLSCSSETAGEAGVDDTRWAPTTTAYDPTCASGCEVLQEGEFGHIGGITLSFDPKVDDAVAQWGDCIESFRLCIEGGGEVRGCSEGSVCPEDCRADLAARLPGAGELEAGLAAFEAVYLDEGAPCLPPLEEVSP
jgi:hypothetical protein